MLSDVTAFIDRRWHAAPGSYELHLEALQGGLEATVTRAHVRPGTRGSTIPPCFVVKQLPIGNDREARVYSVLWGRITPPPTARVLGEDVVGRRTYLYLEDVRPQSSWPWSDIRVMNRVSREVARFHQRRDLPRDPFTWDYDGELMRSAEATVALAEAARGPDGCRCWTHAGDLRRVVAALPAIRRHLLATGTTVIHGDMHPGNVLLRTTGDALDVVLIDWGRARLGSPFEDVASWLHALGCWEPQARRRHDTLMRAYLEARVGSGTFTPALRVDYWLAAVSNALSGAIRYHLAVLSEPRSSMDALYHSRLALAAWRRVVRRAATLVRTSHLR